MSVKISECQDNFFSMGIAIMLVKLTRRYVFISKEIIRIAIKSRHMNVNL